MKLLRTIIGCIEKGYAAYTGPRTQDPAWKRRAQGWIRVMYLDAVVAMIIYTSEGAISAIGHVLQYCILVSVISIIGVGIYGLAQFLIG